MKRLLLIPMMMIALTGCIDPKELIGTLSTTTAGVLGTAVGGPIGGVVAGVVTGVVTDAVVTDSTEDEVEVLETVPEEQRASVLKWESFWMAIETLGIWIIGALVFVWIVPSPRAMWKGMK